MVDGDDLLAVPAEHGLLIDLAVNLWQPENLPLLAVQLSARGSNLLQHEFYRGYRRLNPLLDLG